MKILEFLWFGVVFLLFFFLIKIRYTKSDLYWLNSSLFLLPDVSF